MDDTEIKKFRRNAIGYAKRRGYSQFADDYASFALLKWVEGKFIKNKWVFIDFLRQFFGDYKTEHGTRKALAEYNHIPLEKMEISFVEKTNWINLIQGIDLTIRERVTFLVIYQYGFTQAEVADLLGTHRSVINTLVKLVHDKIKLVDIDLLNHSQIKSFNTTEPAD